MSVYYADELVTLYHGDCLQIDEWLTADVLVTDPPYGTQHTKDNPRGGYGRRYLYDTGDGMGAAIAGDATTDTRDDALAKWGERPAFVFTSPRQSEPPGRWDHRLVWDKKRPGMNSGPWRYTHETIYVRGEFERRRNDAFSVFSAWPGRDQKRHIHAKPVSLMMHLIEVTDDEAIIADPFAGSGSTLVAARDLGRRAIGVEIEERYCEVVATRLSQGVLA